jgi:hypothetical protein
MEQLEIPLKAFGLQGAPFREITRIEIEHHPPAFEIAQAALGLDGPLLSWDHAWELKARRRLIEIGQGSSHRKGLPGEPQQA